MKNVVLFGECMVELMRASKGVMNQSFAGDVFNTAVYLKRTFKEINVALVTAVGIDDLSDEMVDSFVAEDINTDFVFRTADKMPGLYAIKTDESGERSFSYWRDNSAAREIMKFITDEVVDKLSNADVFFYSGISLAVVLPEHRALFWQMIDRLKSNGVSIVFDPNYRARLWASLDETKAQYEQAFKTANKVLPGVDDFVQLYAINTAAGVNTFCQQHDIGEVVIKNGEHGVLCFYNDKQYSVAIEPAENVVDTTSAGDSFNGVYLGARLLQYDIDTSIKLAAKAAAIVIAHRGAIVPKQGFQSFIHYAQQIK